MAVTVTRRTYTTPFKPASTTNWVLGNVGDWLKLTLDCQFAIEKRFDIGDALTINDPNQLILNDGTTWGENGFAIGMFCHFDFYYVDISVNPAISYFNRVDFYVGNIVGDTLYAVNAAGNALTSWGYQYGQIAPIRFTNYEINRVLVFSDQRPQGIKLTYDQLSNNLVSSGSLASHIDGSKTAFQIENTDTIAIFTPTLFTFILAFQSGMSIEKATVEYRGNAGHIKNYRIEVIFMISPFFEDINNFINNVAPSVVLGANALTDNFEIIGFPVYNNPNCTVKNNPKDTVQFGNTGWFDENFNQLPNEFTFTPVVYKNLAGTVISGLDYANPVTVTTTISGIDNLSGLSRFEYGFIWIPIDEDIYKQNAYPFHKNCKISTGGLASTLSDWFPLSPTINSPFPLLRLGYSIDNAKINASDISFVQSGTDVIMTLTFRPSTEFNTYMSGLSDSERQYALWVSVGDQASTTNKSDRVSLLLDFNTLTTFIEPIGAFPGLSINFLDHPQAYTDTPVICGNLICVEDDILAKIGFQIDTAISSIIPIPTAITFGVLVQNAVTGQQYILDNTQVDLTQYPDPTQFNFDASRGFKLGTGNSKNWLKVDHDATQDSGTLKGVLGWYGYKVRWEDWIKRFPIPPSDFYDNTLSQNGQNNDWFEYFNTVGWSLNFFVNINAQLNGTSVVYQNLRELVVRDYDVNTIITTTLKYYRDNSGVKGVQLIGGTDPVTSTPLGVIIKNEIIWLDIEYTRSSGTWLNLLSTYGVNCIEVSEGAGQFEFRQLSSIWASEFDDPMIAIVGQSLAFLTLVSPTKIMVSTRIDANKLIDSQRYKISGRLGCK